MSEIGTRLLGLTGESVREGGSAEGSGPGPQAGAAPALTVAAGGPAAALPLLRVEGLRKVYRSAAGEVMAVDGLSLEVARGETVVLMGPSGCGKSTTLRCLNRLTEPDGGEIWLDGVPVHQLDEAGLRAIRRRIGFVFQHFQLIGRMTILENVALGLAAAGLSPRLVERRARAALSRVGLADYAQRRPAELSGGQRQRAAIARALALEPDVMLWDEPTAALDPVLVQEVLELIARLAREAETAMLVVTHEITFAARIADRLLLMEHGRIVESGPPAQVLGAPQSPLGQAYRQLLLARLEDGAALARLGLTPAAAAGPVAEPSGEE